MNSIINSNIHSSLISLMFRQLTNVWSKSILNVSTSLGSILSSFVAIHFPVSRAVSLRRPFNRAWRKPCIMLKRISSLLAYSSNSTIHYICLRNSCPDILTAPPKSTIQTVSYFFAHGSFCGM